jgi:RimJ/RimL family protein N-acetyltransferase
VEPPTLSDHLVQLRPPRSDDVSAVFAACSDPSTARWLSSLPEPYRQEDAEEFVNQIVPAGWAHDTRWTFATADTATDQLVGMIGLADFRPDLAQAEVGFWVGSWGRRRGYATAALRLICRWGFVSLGLARIEWYAYVGNEPSWRVAQKVGFVREGTLRSRMVHRATGDRRDAWIASLLRTDLVSLG